MISPVTLIIPAYNEESRIQKTLEDLICALDGIKDISLTIHVVLNGCRDQTESVLQQLIKTYPQIDYSVHDQPIGKGGALIEGLRMHRECELIGYIDADGATSPDSILRLIRACQHPSCGAAIGSRWIPGANIIKLQRKRRRLASRCFHMILETLFGMGIKDTQCGAKVFRKEAIEPVLDELLITDMSFDVNLLYCIYRRGFKIKEIPVTWCDQSGSKVHLVKTSLSMLFSVVRLRWIYSPLARFRPLFHSVELWIYRILK